MQRIGMLTIGQSPREDILEGMRPYLTHAVEIVQRGALDDLDDATLAALRPEPGGSVLVTRLRDGTEVQVSHEKLVPLLREGVNHLQECGVAFIVALCTGELTDLQSDVLIVYPSRLLQGVVTGLAQGRSSRTRTRRSSRSSTKRTRPSARSS